MASIEFERGQFLSEADQARIQDALTAYPNVVPFLETAAKCNAYRADADFGLKPNEFLDIELLGSPTASSHCSCTAKTNSTFDLAIQI